MLPNPGYSDKILTGLAADPPDLTMIYTDEFAPSAKRNALKPVDDLLKAGNLTGDIWYPGIWNMSQWQGKALRPAVRRQLPADGLLEQG